MRREVVIDSSVSAAWFLPDERSDDSERLLSLVARRHLRVAVPELWHYELLNVLRTAVLRGRVTALDARKAATLMGSLPVESVPAGSQGHSEIVTAAIELGLSAYDAAYIGLAQMRGDELITADTAMLDLRLRFPWIRSLDEFLARASRGSGRSMSSWRGKTPRNRRRRGAAQASACRRGWPVADSPSPRPRRRGAGGGRGSRAWQGRGRRGPSGRAGRLSIAGR